MLWLLFALLTTLTWGIYDLLAKPMEENMNYFFALLIIGLVQVIIAVPFVIYAYSNGALDANSKGYLLSSIMGILLGLGTVFFFYTFKYGAKASIVIPAYSVGVLIVGAIGGILFFQEAVNLKIILGFIAGIISIILLVH